MHHTTLTFTGSCGALLLVLATIGCQQRSTHPTPASATTVVVAPVGQQAPTGASPVPAPTASGTDAGDVTGGRVVALRDGVFRVDSQYGEQLLEECSTMRPLVQTIPVKTDDGMSALKLIGGKGDDARHTRARDVLTALGLRVGDVVVAIDGTAVGGAGSAPKKPWETSGKTVVRIVRDGTTLERTYLFTKP